MHYRATLGTQLMTRSHEHADLVWIAKIWRVNRGNTKPFQTKPTLLNKPGYSLMHGSARFG